MSLTLTITSYQRQTLGSDASKVFTDSGGSIGRAPDNDWILPDPERYISGRHAVISYQDGNYYLTDISKNGVYVNGSTTPIGNGNSILLNNGDILSLGDYELTVSIDATDADTLPSVSQDPDQLFQESSAGSGDFREPLEPLVMDIQETTGPDLELVMDPVTEDNFAPILSEAYRPPRPVVEQIPEQIPDDWDKTDFIEGGVVEQPDLPQQEAHLDSQSERSSSYDRDVSTSQPARAAITENASPSPQSASSSTNEDLLAAFLQGMGLETADLGRIDRFKAMEGFGVLFRELIQGLMDVLMARATMKNEFRMPLTTIRPAENNPLKFSPTAEDALHLLFSQKSKGYLSPGASIREAFDDIKHHQMAMIAGIQAAFQETLRRFAPQQFEEHDTGKVQAMLPMAKKSKSWDNYCEYYQNLAKDSENCFQELFGEKFAQVYEEQIQRMTSMRYR